MRLVYAVDDGVAEGLVLLEGADGGVAALAELGAVHGEPGAFLVTV